MGQSSAWAASTGRAQNYRRFRAVRGVVRESTELDVQNYHRRHNVYINWTLMYVRYAFATKWRPVVENPPFCASR